MPLTFQTALENYSNEFQAIVFLITNPRVSDTDLKRLCESAARQRGGKLTLSFEETYPRQDYPEVYEQASAESIDTLNQIAARIQTMYEQNNLDRVVLEKLCSEAKAITHPGLR